MKAKKLIEENYRLQNDLFRLKQTLKEVVGNENQQIQERFLNTDKYPQFIPQKRYDKTQSRQSKKSNHQYEQQSKHQKSNQRSKQTPQFDSEEQKEYYEQVKYLYDKDQQVQEQQINDIIANQLKNTMKDQIQDIQEQIKALKAFSEQQKQQSQDYLLQHVYSSKYCTDIDFYQHLMTNRQFQTQSNGSQSQRTREFERKSDLNQFSSQRQKRIEHEGTENYNAPSYNTDRLYKQEQNRNQDYITFNQRNYEKSEQSQSSDFDENLQNCHEKCIIEYENQYITKLNKPKRDKFRPFYTFLQPKKSEQILISDLANHAQGYQTVDIQRTLVCLIRNTKFKVKSLFPLNWNFSKVNK